MPDAVVRHVHAASTGEGTPVFQHYVERNRLLMLVKNAPRRLAADAVWRYRAHHGRRYARRDVVRPGARAGTGPSPTIVWRRVRSFVDFLRLLPRRRSRRGDASGGPPPSATPSWPLAGPPVSAGDGAPGPP